jgi:RimJ/RimL family protein N-acetyltransferase
MATILETKRCRLRSWSLDDVPAAHAWMSDPEVFRYLGGPATVCATREDTERAVAAGIARDRQTGWTMWACDSLEDGKLIGRAGIKQLDGGWARFDPTATYEMEVGYAFARDRWGQGLASEVASALVEWGFRERELSRIVGVCQAENRASRRVLEKAGLVFVEQRHFSAVGYEGMVDYLALDAPSP